MRHSSFIDVPLACDFPIQNLPWGVFTRRAGVSTIGRRSIGVALGSHVIDVGALADAGLMSGPELSKGAANGCFHQPSLNRFMSLGRPAWREARQRLTQLLGAEGEGALRDDEELRRRAIVPMADVEMHLPAEVGDYTDFYASREHATAVGSMFRGKDNALQPNWTHLPVGYHGRSSSLVVSGAAVRRPRGQIVPAGGDRPTLAPCAALDFELEMACFIGPGNILGHPIGVDTAAQHLFGLVLLNDWSARDIQKWEYVPLGPFNGKNWATQMSPWVVTMDALEPFRVPAPPQDPEVLPYLQEAERCTYDVRLEVDIVPALPAATASPSTTSAASVSGTSHCSVATSNLKHLYWTLPQMVAHHSVGGCNLRPGDLLATGTISGDGPGQAGCLLEATLNGARPLQLQPRQESAPALPPLQPPSSPSQPCAPVGSSAAAEASSSSAAAAAVTRTWLQDGDTVVLRGYCQGDGFRVGFGECRGTVLPCLAV